VKSLGVYLGSFDPLHAGHEYIIRSMLDRCERVLVCIPSAHPEKPPPAMPHSMPFGVRLDQLRNVFSKEFRSGQLGVGMAKEGLFIRLHWLLRGQFPEARIRLAMGNDTWECALASKEYFELRGEPWGEAEEEGLKTLCVDAVVFGRTPRDSVLVRQLCSSDDGAITLRDSQVDAGGPMLSVLRSSGDELRRSSGLTQSEDADAVYDLGDDNVPEEALQGRMVSDTGTEVVIRRVSTDGEEKVPSAAQGLSSTWVRDTVAKCSDPESLHEKLKGKVPDKVVSMIITYKLYKEDK